MLECCCSWREHLCQALVGVGRAEQRGPGVELLPAQQGAQGRKRIEHLPRDKGHGAMACQQQQQCRGQMATVYSCDQLGGGQLGEIVWF